MLGLSQLGQGDIGVAHHPHSLAEDGPGGGRDPAPRGELDPGGAGAAAGGTRGDAWQRQDKARGREAGQSRRRARGRQDNPGLTPFTHTAQHP